MVFSRAALAATALLLSTASCVQIPSSSSSSPFFLLSSTPLHDSTTLRSKQLALASQVTDETLAAFRGCDAELYLIVSQPGLSAGDFEAGKAMPRMRRRMLQGADMYEAAVQIPEVIGDVDVEEIQRVIGERCSGRKVSVEDYYQNGHGHGDQPIITALSLPALHPDAHARQEGLEAADAEIENILTTKANHTKHVLIFVSSPSTSSSQQDAVADESQTYEMDSPILHEVLHSDLKRDVGVYPRNSSSEDEHQKGLPLFERYSFLSPAIFMGLTVTILLISILYVGLSAIAGLEVSYMAFSKEMGPAAQQGKTKLQ